MEPNLPNAVVIDSGPTIDFYRLHDCRGADKLLSESLNQADQGLQLQQQQHLQPSQFLQYSTPSVEQQSQPGFAQ